MSKMTEMIIDFISTTLAIAMVALVLAVVTHFAVCFLNWEVVSWNWEFFRFAFWVYVILIILKRKSYESWF